MPENVSPSPAAIPPEPDALVRRVRRFIAEAVIPLEQEAFVGGVDDRLRVRLQDAARAAGVLAPQAPPSSAGAVSDSRSPPCYSRRPATARSGRSP